MWTTQQSGLKIEYKIIMQRHCVHVKNQKPYVLKACKIKLKSTKGEIKLKATYLHERACYTLQALHFNLKAIGLELSTSIHKPNGLEPEAE
jgi:hypothetical protein